MKRFILFLLLLPSICFADGYVIGWPAGGFSCADYLVCQNFEGAGYDNSETWTEGGTGTKDEDYATAPAPLCGSQSLGIDATAATGSTYGTFASTDEVWMHFLYYVPAAAPASNNIISSVQAGASGRGAVLYRTDGAWGMQHGSVFWNSGATKPTAATLYHVWWHYVPETNPGVSNDGVNELWWGTTVNRSEATSVAQQSNGNGDGAITRWYFNNGIAGTGVYIFDQGLLDNAEFTTVPSCP